MFVFPLILYDVSVLFIAFNNPVWNQRCLHCMLRKWSLPPPAIQRGKPLSSTFHPRLAATNVREPTNTNEWLRRDNDSKTFRILANVQKRMQTFFKSWMRMNGSFLLIVKLTQCQLTRVSFYVVDHRRIWCHISYLAILLLLLFFSHLNWTGSRKNFGSPWRTVTKQCLASTI